MLKVALVGVGGISGAHIPVWEQMDDTELVALCDIREEKMENYRNKHCYTDFDEMLKNESIDILDICLPTYLHADFAIKAMNQGIHVISEKPISLKKEDVKRVYDAARENNVKFMVAQVLRFWPEYEFVKELYDSKKYGKLISGSMQRLGAIPQWSWDNWMADENRSGLVPYDLHVHDLDFMIYAFGIPKNVKSNRSKSKNADVIHAVYEFDDFFVSSDATWYNVSYPFTSNFRFQFEHAVVEKKDEELIVYEENGNIIKIGDEDEVKGDTGSINLPKSNAYANEIRYFTDCVENDMAADKIKSAELEAVIEILNNL